MAGKTLEVAANQWANRPDDQRFWTIQDAKARSKAHADSAIVKAATMGALRLEADGTRLNLVGKSEIPAELTHYSFGQLSRLLGAPASYLRALPATLAAQNLNHGLKARAERSLANQDEDKVNLLMHRNGHFLARSINTDTYDRVWNWEVFEAIERNLLSEGWRVAPARPSPSMAEGITRLATEADVIDWKNANMGGAPIKVGDRIGPAGIYVSDHDMFAFLVYPQATMDVDGTVLSAFSITRNSEVGECSVEQTIGLCDGVCGNHLIWGARDITRVSAKHVKGENRERGNTMRNFEVKSAKLAGDFDLRAFERQIQAAKGKVIAATKDEVLDGLFAFAKKRNLTLLSRKALAAGYEIAENTPRYGNPNTVWAQVNGLTELSQKTGYADDRHAMDIQAGRLMEMTGEF